MNTARHVIAGLLVAATLAAAAPARAQEAAAFSKEQLEQMVAPIALYPDSLLTQILMAATYPLEVVEAARWSAQNPKLDPKAVEAAVMEKSWDASVKSLCGFPDVLKKMNDNLDWTQDLGDAFLTQEAQLLDTVQIMRGKAHDAGQLKTTEQQVVTQEADKIIVIESADPEVIYVPTYSPEVVYAGWGYPSYYYPPMYAPYPYPYGGALAFGLGVAWGAAMWGDCNWGWGGSDVNIDVDRYNNFDRNTNINHNRNDIQGGQGGRSNWNHSPEHRKGVNYKNNSTAQKYGGSGASSRVTNDQARGWSGSTGARPSTGAVGAGQRPSGSAGARPSTGASSTGSRYTGGSSTRPATSPSRSSSSSGMSSSSRGSYDRSASSRGASSRSSSSYGGSASRSGGGGGRRR